jgi:hypothetical protein
VPAQCRLIQLLTATGLKPCRNRPQRKQRGQRRTRTAVHQLVQHGRHARVVCCCYLLFRQRAVQSSLIDPTTTPACLAGADFANLLRTPIARVLNAGSLGLWVLAVVCHHFHPIRRDNLLACCYVTMGSYRTHLANDACSGGSQWHLTERKWNRTRAHFAGIDSETRFTEPATSKELQYSTSPG